MGLSSALRSYIEGFAERSKIKTDLEIPNALGRLSRDVETAIFRVVQECLTNIHRHSGSAVANVTISRADHNLRLEVRDEGKGISTDKREEMEMSGRAGVGIRGMRERIRQLGGSLEISSPTDSRGTVVIARFPIDYLTDESSP